MVITALRCTKAGGKREERWAAGHSASLRATDQWTSGIIHSWQHATCGVKQADGNGSHLARNRACAGMLWRAFWVGLPACGAALGALLSVADLWGPGRPSQLGTSVLANAYV